MSEKPLEKPKVPCRRAEELTDDQWMLLAPLIPEPPRRPDGRGRPWRSCREVMNGVLWVLRTGAPWADCLGGSRRTRPAIAASRFGAGQAYWNKC